MAGTSRSPNYPGLSLQQAVEAAKALYEREKRTALSHETAVLAMGFKSLSGPARVAIAALRQYGLVDKAEKGHIRLSDLGLTALRGTDHERAEAWKRAALMPELFQQLAATHPDGSETAIRSFLVTKKGFMEDGARKAAKTFKDSLQFASVNLSDYNPAQQQEKPQAMSGIETGQSGVGRPAEGGVLSLKVPYKTGALAIEIRSTERLTRAHIEKVRKYLELAEDDLSDGGEDA